MENMDTIRSSVNHHIKIGVLAGHFATNHSHVSHYIDMTTIKTKCNVARDVAGELASKYYDTDIDTIICLEGTQMVGAFLAERLSAHGSGMNQGKNISVITPELNSNNQMIFRDNVQRNIFNRKIMLLISSASSGKTINRSVECLAYYNGQLAGICALFSAIDKYNGMPIKAMFTYKDIPDYFTSPAIDCPLCKANQRVDAVITSFGYSKI
ncbi:MAG: orotate phosphoribosyltransferase [Ruminococcus sp.]|nr:orotate phosphoribosyltransferase [Ruminococcus sp.]MCD7801235.1 orotate phosphoribosyltransferase [Ruminococcus sp.]